MDNTKLFWGIILLAFVIALFPYASRWEVEQENRSIQFIFDDHSMFRLARKTGSSVEEVYSRLEIGEPAVAISPWTPRKMTDRGFTFLWPVLDPDRPIPVPSDFGDGRTAGFSGYYLHFFAEEKKEFVFSRLPDFFQPVPLGGENNFSVPPRDENTLFPGVPLGFNDEDIDLIAATGWPTVGRPNVNQNRGDYDPEELLGDLPRLEGLLFDGGETWGYPENLEETALLLEGKDIYLGFVEPFLAQQKGMRNLGLLEEDRVLRLHSVQQGEMDSQSPERIISRYIRSVRERNVRLLYFRPVLAADRGDLLAQNEALLNNLKERLEGLGYSFGEGGYFQPIEIRAWIVLFIWAGLVAAGLLVLGFFYQFSRKNQLLLFVLGWLGGAGIYLIGFRTLFLQGALLGGALVLPLLPLMVVLEKRKGPFWLDWFLISLGTVLGSFFIGALGADRSFILGLEVFRGVKVALLLPLMILAYYLYRERFAGKWKKMLPSLPVFISLGLMAVALFFYINRSGNFPLIPVPQWEIALREFLERVLVIRPRFKEFMWGHPFLLAGLYLFRQRKWPWIASFSILLGCMGLITMINSFTHFHTPLWVSLWRSILGILLGAGLGLLLVLIIRWLEGVLGREKI